ncbi:uncharacterized protein ABDE67_019018 [Symphorus nematophorus]
MVQLALLQHRTLQLLQLLLLIEGTLGLQFSLNQTFTSDLSNSSSPAFQALAATVVTELNRVGTKLYGSSFSRSIVNSFSSGSVVVNSTLVFTNQSSVPSANNATSQLNSELTSNSSSLNIVSGSVLATSSAVSASTAAPNATATPTAAPTAAPSVTVAPNATAAPTAGPTAATTAGPTAATTAAPTAATTAAPTAATTAAPTAATTAGPTAATTVASTASTDPPTASEGTLGLRFSLNQTFTSDLSDSTSAAFQALASTVVTELNRVGTKLYGSSFSRSIVNSFSSGSVVVNSTLVFTNQSSVPSASDATSQFSTELANSTTLNVIPGSVFAQSTSTSSSGPRPTVGSLAVFSLTLLAVAQMLVDL